MALFLLEQLRAVSRGAEARGDAALLAESAAATASIVAAIGTKGPANGDPS
jgi:mevalonate pyrophosphate decarboxylase